MGKVHNFLGMELDLANEGEVKIDTKQYIGSISEDFEEYFDPKMVPVRCPEVLHLFQFRKNTKKLGVDGELTSTCERS